MVLTSIREKAIYATSVSTKDGAMYAKYGILYMDYLQQKSRAGIRKAKPAKTNGNNFFSDGYSLNAFGSVQLHTPVKDMLEYWKGVCCKLQCLLTTWRSACMVYGNKSG